MASDKNLNWTLPFKCFHLRSLTHFRVSPVPGGRMGVRGASSCPKGIWFFPVWLDQKRTLEPSSALQASGSLYPLPSLLT